MSIPFLLDEKPAVVLAVRLSGTDQLDALGSAAGRWQNAESMIEESKRDAKSLGGKFSPNIFEIQSTKFEIRNKSK
ncbi:MAG: hypothetical protein FJ143_03010 [Deltaproteobacteria bacterium]|nr:hypothetical protein [Deltaproteobacteria bacterium]